MDSEILKAKPFYAKLPKGLKWYSIANSQSFVFYYSSTGSCYQYRFVQ